MKIIFTLNPVGFAGTEISTLKLADSVARLRNVTSVLCFTDKAPDGTYLQRIKAEFKSISVIHEKVIGEPQIPQTGIEEMMVITAGVPAQYGDTTSGVVLIQTRSFR